MDEFKLEHWSSYLQGFVLVIIRKPVLGSKDLFMLQGQLVIWSDFGWLCLFSILVLRNLCDFFRSAYNSINDKYADGKRFLAEGKHLW